MSEDISTNKCEFICLPNEQKVRSNSKPFYKSNVLTKYGWAAAYCSTLIIVKVLESLQSNTLSLYMKHYNIFRFMWYTLISCTYLDLVVVLY